MRRVASVLIALVGLAVRAVAPEVTMMGGMWLYSVGGALLALISLRSPAVFQTLLEAFGIYELAEHPLFGDPPHEELLMFLAGLAPALLLVRRVGGGEQGC